MILDHPSAETGEVACDVCQDCGWQYFECTGDDFCGRRRGHGPHTFVKPCPCRAMNLVYQARKASERVVTR